MRPRSSRKGTGHTTSDRVAMDPDNRQQTDGELIPSILDMYGCRTGRQILPVDVSGTRH
jgi:hypothetical protein